MPFRDICRDTEISDIYNFHRAIKSNDMYVMIYQQKYKLIILMLYVTYLMGVGCGPERCINIWEPYWGSTASGLILGGGREPCTTTLCDNRPTSALSGKNIIYNNKKGMHIEIYKKISIFCIEILRYTKSIKI